MMIRKFIILLTCVCLLSGCYNYRDIDEIIFTTALVLDENEKGKIEIYQELFKAYRGSGNELGKEVRLEYKGTGRTIFEALMNTSTSAGDEIDDSQIKALIFTKKVAENGLDKYIDYFVRSQKPTVRMYMFIYEGDNPKDLAKIKLKEEEFLGLFLLSMMVSSDNLVHLKTTKLNEYKNERMLGSHILLLPVIKKVEKDDKKLEIDGAAIIKDDKYVGKLSKEEMLPLKLATKSGEYGDVIIKRPDTKKGYISLKILSSKSSVSIKYDGKNVIVNKNVDVETSLVGVQYDDFILNKHMVNKIEKRVSKQLERRCTELFNMYKEKDIDLYNIKREVELKYPHIKDKDIIKIAKVGKIKVNVHLEGSENHTDFD